MSHQARLQAPASDSSDLTSEHSDAPQEGERRGGLLRADLWPCSAMEGADHLQIGGCDVVELARSHRTPLYLLDERTLRDACRSYRGALLKYYPAHSVVHYAAKALLNTALVQLVCSEGLGLDVASEGELYVAMRAGAPPSCIRFHGNAKTRAEIGRAVEARVARIVVDNLDELEEVGLAVQRAATPVEISLRIVPEVEADTHTHIRTGHRDCKFGFPLEAIEDALHLVSQSPLLRIAGLHFHLGSQIPAAGCYERAVDVAVELAARLRKGGVEIEEFSPGGGLGVNYTEADQAGTIDSFVEKMSQLVTAAWGRHRLPLPRLVLEPGRSICARAGVALYTIVATKPLRDPSAARRYLHLDGGMADNIRPALYGARYSAAVANRLSETPDEIVHLSGCYCESSDVLVRDIALPRAARPGDIIAVPMAGAYTLSMASNYNGALRPEVLLVANGKARTIQRRESLSDLVARDFPLTED